MTDLFDLRSLRPGVRLQRLELFNWGTFDSAQGEIYSAEPAGRTTLLVGRNGAGKSTLVDAILTLLVPSPIRNYNVAAGAKKTERTEKSYVFGACDQQLDEDHAAVTKRYLRKGTAFYSVILAHFCDENVQHRDGKNGFTVAQLMYPKSDASTDRVLLFADGERSIQADFANLTKTDGIMQTMKSRGFKATRTFSEYHNWFVKRTGVRPLAMDMFNQTVAVKDIQSLNKFIRDHMLESSGSRQRVAKLIEHFSDLRTAHRNLKNVVMQRDLLVPIEKHGGRFNELAGQIQLWQNLLDAIDPFFREATVRLATPELDRLKRELDQNEKDSQRLQLASDSVAEEIRQIKNEIDTAGGQRLREIPRLIETEHARLEAKEAVRNAFLDSLSQTTPDEAVETPEDFERVHKWLGERQAIITTQQQELSEDRDKQIVSRSVCLAERRQLAEELETLQKRRTNLPGHLSRLRTNLCSDMGIAENDLVFASELIAVQDDAADWESSIEKALRGFALSLLVPERLYRQVSNYIDATNLTDGRHGQRLVYLKVASVIDNSREIDRLHVDSLVHKLRFKQGHALTPWVHGHIEKRFDYRCCETVEAFREAPRLAITKNRHVKVGQTRHEKDDRKQAVDPSQFVLGWDNREKKERLAAKIAQLDEQLQTIDAAVNRLDQQLRTLRRESMAVERCLEVARFDAIDCQSHRDSISALREEKQRLENDNDRIRVLKEQEVQKTAELHGLAKDRESVLKLAGRLENDLQKGEQLVKNSKSRLKALRSEKTYERCQPKFAELAEQVDESTLTFENLWQRESDFKQRCEAELKTVRPLLTEIEDDLTKAMGVFLKKCPEERDDLDAAISALPSYLSRLESIRTEGLPLHEARFKERLSDAVTKEIGVFHSELQNEGRTIERKIDELNETLRELPYNDGTHMRLDVRPVKNAEIADFRSSLRSCLDDTFEDTDAAREAQFKRIEALISRLSEQSTWRDRVIDVRRWYNFGACEVETDTDKQRGYYEDSSGKSGGEKAKLAFTILVAAIAYQYDLDLKGNDQAGFRFVVVDEMFSKIDDRFAEYALRLFERFGLQLMIVAPLDAKARVTEPFVQYYLQVLKDEKQYRSQLISMTAKEYEENVVSKLK